MLVFFIPFREHGVNQVQPIVGLFDPPPPKPVTYRLNDPGLSIKAY